MSPASESPPAFRTVSRNLQFCQKENSLFFEFLKFSFPSLISTNVIIHTKIQLIFRISAFTGSLLSEANGLRHLL
jgi:hypothetical protein